VISRHLESGGEHPGRGLLAARRRIALAGSGQPTRDRYFSHSDDQERLLGVEPVNKTSRNPEQRGGSRPLRRLAAADGETKASDSK